MAGSSDVARVVTPLFVAAVLSSASWGTGCQGFAPPPAAPTNHPWDQPNPRCPAVDSRVAFCCGCPGQQPQAEPGFESCRIEVDRQGTCKKLEARKAEEREDYQLNLKNHEISRRESLETLQTATNVYATLNRKNEQQAANHPNQSSPAGPGASASEAGSAPAQADSSVTPSQRPEQSPASQPTAMQPVAAMPSFSAQGTFTVQQRQFRARLYFDGSAGWVIVSDPTSRRSIREDLVPITSSGQQILLAGSNPRDAKTGRPDPSWEPDTFLVVLDGSRQWILHAVCDPHGEQCLPIL